MEHAKKLALVDPANLDVGNVKRRYGELDRNISDVLNRDDLDEREKLRLYQNALNRFLVNKRAVENDLSEPVKVAGATDAQLQTLLTRLLARASDPLPVAPTPTPTTSPLAPSADTPPSSRQSRRPHRSPPPQPTQRKRIQPTRKTTEWLRYGGAKQ